MIGFKHGNEASSGLTGCVCSSFCHLWKAAGFRFPCPIIRINVRYVCVGEQWLCADFTFILVQLPILSCHNSVVMVWLDQGTCSIFLSEISLSFNTNMAVNCPDITLKILGFLVANKLWDILTFHLKYQVVWHLQMLKGYLKQQFSHSAAGSCHTSFSSLHLLTWKSTHIYEM